MKTKQTVVNQLLPLIPDGDEIMNYIRENNADARMLDDWLYQRMFKGRDWEQLEKEQIIKDYASGYLKGAFKKQTTEEQYYNETYKRQENDKI